jgi:hypothetical protein
MANNFLEKALIIIMYLIIIILIPLFLDWIFRLTVRKNRKNKILAIAKKKSLDTGKPIIIFNDRYNGMVLGSGEGQPNEEFIGDIVEITNQMADNSCILIVSETLEYIDNTNNLLSQTINTLYNVSGGDLYCINFEKNSPRILWDYKLKNIMDKCFYLPENKITWTKPNQLQHNTQQLYFYIFKILPYHFFAYDPVIKN